MNVLKPHLRVTIRTLLDGGVSQREIERMTRRGSQDDPPTPMSRTYASWATGLNWWLL
jgi:hypothetical protein